MRNKQDSWDEWTAFQADDAGAVHELAGIFLSMHVDSDNGNFVRLSGKRIWVFKRAVALHKQISNEKISIAHNLEIPQNYRGRIKLLLPKDEFLNLASPDPFASRRKGWHWLRGLYGNCGNIFAPRTGYYLVIRTSSDDIADKAERLFSSDGYVFSRRFNEGANELMLRKQDAVVSFLNGIGLNGLALDIEDRSILRSVRDRANRLVNCDAANITKSVRAAEEQIEIAKKIKKSPVYEKLPSHFLQLIDTRLENPSATLSDLGLLLSPPVSKSTVRYRWGKIQEILGKTPHI